MFDDEEDGPQDWEMDEEVPSKNLQNKWFMESLSFNETVICLSCEKGSRAKP